MLDMTLRDIERILYFEAYVVIEPGLTPLERGQLLTEEQYHRAMRQEHGDDFDAAHGRRGRVRPAAHDRPAGARWCSCARRSPRTSSETKLKRLTKRIKLVEAFLESGNRPSGW